MLNSLQNCIHFQDGKWKVSRTLAGFSLYMWELHHILSHGKNFTCSNIALLSTVAIDSVLCWTRLECRVHLSSTKTASGLPSTVCLIPCEGNIRVTNLYVSQSFSKAAWQWPSAVASGFQAYTFWFFTQPLLKHHTNWRTCDYGFSWILNRSDVAQIVCTSPIEGQVSAWNSF